MILHFHIEEYVRLNALEHQRDSITPHHPSQRFISSPNPVDAGRSGLRHTLLDNINRRFGLKINDFGSSWRDGEALLAMIDSILPQMRAREKGRAVLSNRARLQLAFDLAERHLGIIKLLDAEDIDVDRPDERSIMTYVSQFLQKQPKKEEPEIFMVQPTQIISDQGGPIRRWIANLVKTGINKSNLVQLQREQAEMKSEFDRVKDTLDPETIRNWHLIENELAIAKQVLDWIGIAEEMLASYSVPTSGEQVEEQLRRHKLFFACLPKLQANSNLWDSIAAYFKQTIRLADEWLEAMLEASRRWEQYHLAADELKGWLTTAETKLAKSHQPHLSNQQQTEYLNDLKKFFSQRSDNEKILYNFVMSCNDVLATLPESHQTGLKETLHGLESRFHEITNFKAPQHLIRFEFDLTETDFMARLNNEAENEEAILEDLNSMENLGTVYWKRFNDKSILDRAMFNRREFIKRKKKMREDIAFIKQETMDLISVAESQLKSITIDSQVETLRHNEYTLNKIREQLNVLKQLSNEANVDLENELKQIENHLERLAESLKNKKKEKIINWLENEAPQKLELFRSGSDHSLKDEVNKYRQMIIEEKELIEKVKLIDVQITLINMERCKVGNVEEAKQKVKSYQSMKNLSPELEKYLKFLEEVVLVEWEAVEKIKNDLKAWLTGRKEFTREELKEKKDECDKLLERFEKNKTIIEKLASDSALTLLQKDLSDIIYEYDTLWRAMEQDVNKLTNNQQKDEPMSGDDVSRLTVVSTVSQAKSTPSTSTSSGQEVTRQVKSIIEETVQRYEKTEKYEITRREKREEIIGDDVVGSAVKDVTLHVDSIKDVIEVKERPGESNQDETTIIKETIKIEKTKEDDSELVKRKISSLIDKLKEIEEWVRVNDLDQLMKELLPYCDENCVTKVTTIKETWTIRKRQLSDIKEELKKSNIADEKLQDVNKLLDDILKKMDEFDFDEAVKVMKEAMSFRDWLDECKKKVESIEGTIKSSEKSVERIEEMKNNLDKLLTKIDKIDLNSIEKYIKVVEKVEEEKTILTKLSDNLDLLKEKVLLKAKMEEEAAREAAIKRAEEVAAREAAEAALREAAEKAAQETIETTVREATEAAAKETAARAAQFAAEIESEESIIPSEEVRSTEISNLHEDSANEELEQEEEIKETVQASQMQQEEKEPEPIDVGTTLSDWKQYYNQLATWLRTNDDILDSLMDKPFTTIETIEETIRTIETMREERITKKEQGLALIDNIGDTSDKESIEAKAQSDLSEIEEKLNELNSKGDQLKDKLTQILTKHQEMINTLEEINSWLDDVEKDVTSTELKSNLPEKKEKLELLESYKNNIDSKADDLKKLNQGVEELNGMLSDEVEQLDSRYQTINSSVEEAINKWAKYVNDHATLDDLHQTCKDINSKTTLRMKESEEIDDLEDKLAELNDLINNKESKGAFEKLDEQLQKVLYQTNNLARSTVSTPIRETIRERNDMLNKLKSARAITNEKFAILQASQSALKQITKALDEIEYSIVEASLFTCSLSEKKSQWDKAKQLFRDCKLIDINSLSDKPEIAKEYAALIVRHESALAKLEDLVDSNEKAYKDHQAFKESCDDVAQWMKNLKDRVPSLSAGCLSDRLSLETTISTLSDLLSRRSAGDEKLANMKELGAIALETSSTDGKKLINRNTDNLEKDYASLLGEIEKTIEHLQVLMVELKKFKEEYEDTNEWLQTMESEIKQERTICRGATLQEKQANVATCNKLMEQLEKGREETIGKLWKKDVLLNSHLENYIRNQLKLLESRYQVMTNLLKDVASKVNEIAENHELFHNKCQQAQAWIAKASDKLESISNFEGKKEAIETNLKLISDLTKRNQDEGQILVHQALNAGEKALRSTPSQGRDVITLEIHEIQSKWDRYLSKVSETKSILEMALIQCQEQQLARNKMKQWLKEQEARAQSLRENNSDDGYGSIKENLKSKMRKFNSLLQDLESHPEAHSVTKSSPELQVMYDKLISEVKEDINLLQTKLDQIEDFNNYCDEVRDWLTRSKEDLNRCSSTIEDRESIQEKVILLKQLTEDEEGAEKLRAAVRCADLCKKDLTPERATQLDDIINGLSSDLESHRQAISAVKSALDVGVAKWAEYDSQFSKCETWLKYIEPILKEFTEPQKDLLSKRSKLEEFQQQHLQQIFDWQTEFHILNVKAQLLLETYADSSISAAFTQLSARYNDLVSEAKDVLHSLQQIFQEHQQQQSILTECIEFVDRTREKFEDVTRHLDSPDPEELNTALTKVRSLIDSLKGQGETKMSYLDELTVKVIEHTHPDGIDRIKEDISQLKQDFNNLVRETKETKTTIESKIGEINQFDKIWNQVIDWFETDVEGKMIKLDKDGDKRILLNLLRLIEKDVNTHQELIGQLSEYKDKFPQAEEFLTQRYQPRVEVLSDTINKLIEEIKTDEKFKQSCKEAQDWIKSIHERLEALTEKPSDKESVVRRIEMLQEIQDESGDEKVKKAINWSRELGKEEEEKEFTRELEWYNETLGQWKVKSIQCLEFWNDYETLYKELSKWITRITEESQKEDSDIDELLQESINKKESFDQLNTLMDSLTSLANTSSLKEGCINLTSMYSSLISLLRKKTEKSRLIRETQCKLNQTRDQLNDWMDNTLESIQRSFDNPKDRLAHLKETQSHINDGQSLVSTLAELTAKLVSEVDDKIGAAVREQLDESKTRFDDVTDRLNESVKNLTSQLDRYEEYNATLEALAKWLQDNPEVFAEKVNHNGDLHEIKGEIEKYKALLSIIEKNLINLEKLSTEIAIDAADEDRITLLTEQYSQGESNCNSLLDQLETDLNDISGYHQLLQKVEKWLLQQSYSLMAHLSLSINTLSQCRQELEKHRKMLKDIESYPGLEELRLKGEQVVKECGYDEEKVKGQYNNIKETFDALVSQGKRIEAQLAYALEKFEIYEQTLNRCEAILNEMMGKDIRMEVPPLQEAVEELEKAKSVHDKLYEAKNELQQAIQGCSEATAAVSRPPSPEIPLNQGLGIPEREVEIKCRLEDSLDHVKQQVTSIQELVDQWKDSEHKMGHYFIVDIVRLLRRMHRPS